MWRADSLEKILMLGKTEDRRRRGRQRTRWLDGIADSMDMVSAISARWWRTGKHGVLQSIGSERVGYNWVTEKQPAHFDFTKKLDVKISCLWNLVWCIFPFWVPRIWICKLVPPSPLHWSYLNNTLLFAWLPFCYHCVLTFCKCFFILSQSSTKLVE